MRKKIIILFGEMGAGKNYTGERLAQSLGVPFFDGDDVATPEMKENISKFKPITKNLIEDYMVVLTNAIADKIQESDDGLVVAQALYAEKDREFVQRFLWCLGYDVEYRWVKTSFWQNMKQLYSRKNGAKWVAYWLIHKPFFQKPGKEIK